MTRRILRFDPVRQRRIIVIGIGRHLPGDRTQPSAAVAWLYGATGFGAPGTIRNSITGRA